MPVSNCCANPGRRDGGRWRQLVVRVEGRKGDLLYLNDGVYGGILEGGPNGDQSYPAHAVRAGNGKRLSTTMAGFRLAGPTCDSYDMMKTPFILPEDIKEGDFIVLDQLGAYGEVSRTDFNGFDTVYKVELFDKKAKAKVKIAKVA